MLVIAAPYAYKLMLNKMCHPNVRRDLARGQNKSRHCKSRLRTGVAHRTSDQRRDRRGQNQAHGKEDQSQRRLHGEEVTKVSYSNAMEMTCRRPFQSKAILRIARGWPSVSPSRDRPPALWSLKDSRENLTRSQPWAQASSVRPYHTWPLLHALLAIISMQQLVKPQRAGLTEKRVV